MTAETWGGFVVTVVVLMCTPGPSQLLMMSNSMANGFRRSLATASGDLTANVFQMLAANIGLGSLIVVSVEAFRLIKWCGVVYLVWLGANKIRSAGRTGSPKSSRASIRRLWFQGFATSGANPKAVVFFVAFFPQFIDPNGVVWSQSLLLGTTYLAIDGTFLAIYGGGAEWLTAKIDGGAEGCLDRLSGAFLITAGLMLGLKTAQQ